jgi:hypothetical protein
VANSRRTADRRHGITTPGERLEVGDVFEVIHAARRAARVQLAKSVRAARDERISFAEIARYAKLLARGGPQALRQRRQLVGLGAMISSLWLEVLLFVFVFGWAAFILGIVLYSLYKGLRGSHYHRFGGWTRMPPFYDE